MEDTTKSGIKAEIRILGDHPSLSAALLGAVDIFESTGIEIEITIFRSARE